MEVTMSEQTIQETVREKYGRGTACGAEERIRAAVEPHSTVV
jgi:hypothetical protein